MRTSRRKNARPSNARPSKEQVRAWLTTVIAPMASALAIEQERASRGTWTFRCETQDFELLWPIERMIAVPYLANLAQLLRYRADLKELCQDHDGALAKLLGAAKRAFEKVIQSEQFRTLTASMSIAESDRKYLAEYVVNGIRDLPSHDMHHDMWRQEGGRFLVLREDPVLASDFRSLMAVGRDFARAVRALQRYVGTLQVELSDKYKLPPVGPADFVRV